MIDKINGLNGVHSWMEKTNEIIDELNTNTSDISTNATNISLNDTDISNLDGRLTTAENDIDSAEGRLTSLEDNTNLLNRIKTIDGSGSLIDSDKLDGQDGSYYRNASNLNAGTVPAARLSGSYNIDTTGLVKGIDIDQTYRSGVANTLIRMGSGDSTNWDGIKYDDATNNFIFKADTSHADNTYGISGVVAQRGRFIGDEDASATSTNHPLELGSNGTFAKLDGNEIYWFNTSGSSGAVFYDKILQKTDLEKNYYGNANGADAWIVAENFAGDTGIGLTDTYVHRYVVDNMAWFNMRLKLTGFSKVAAGDDTFTFRFDIGSFVNSAGWGRKKILDGGYGQAHGQFMGSGFDSPDWPFYCSINSYAASSYPNTIYFTSRDRHPDGQTNPSTSLELVAMWTCRIGD